MLNIIDRKINWFFFKKNISSRVLWYYSIILLYSLGVNPNIRRKFQKRCNNRHDIMVNWVFKRLLRCLGVSRKMQRDLFFEKAAISYEYPNNHLMFKIVAGNKILTGMKLYHNKQTWHCREGQKSRRSIHSRSGSRAYPKFQKPLTAEGHKKRYQLSKESGPKEFQKHPERTKLS